jgi:hypothetical protein
MRHWERQRLEVMAWSVGEAAVSEAGAEAVTGAVSAASRGERWRTERERWERWPLLM